MLVFGMKVDRIRWRCNDHQGTDTRYILQRQVPLLIYAVVNRLGIRIRNRRQEQQGKRVFHSAMNLPTVSVSVGTAASLKLTLFAGLLLLGGCSDSATQYVGIWKDRCDDYWGVQMQARAEGLYAVTFCGLSGCLAPGEWMPDTRIIDDPLYQVVSSTRIRIKRGAQDFYTYTRCSHDPSWKT